MGTHIRADLARLEQACKALGDLTDRFVFAGGTITSLLITDAAAPQTRATTDIDVVVKVLSQKEYYKLADALRSKNFREDTADPPIICRWRHGEDLVLDVMPTDEEILGFSNRWYPDAYRRSVKFQLETRSIKIVSSVYFIATKLEAFAGRGNGDYQASHDMEDFIAVVDGRPSLLTEYDDSESDVREYLVEQVKHLLSTQEFLSSLPGHIGGEIEREKIILNRLRYLAKLFR